MNGWGNTVIDTSKPNSANLADAPAPPYMRDLVLAHDCVRYPMCIGMADQYVGYVVPAYNFVLSADPYLSEAESDPYEETYALSPLVEQHIVHPILDLLKFRRERQSEI